MGSPPLTVLRPGDWVHFDGGEHQVVAVAGTSVRLRAPVGTESVVLASYLMASPGFMVVGGAPGRGHPMLMQVTHQCQSQPAPPSTSPETTAHHLGRDDFTGAEERSARLAGSGLAS